MSVATARPEIEAASPGLEGRTLALGREIFSRIGRGASIRSRAWWDDRLMALTMGDASVKVQLFRFIDALPALRTPAAIRGHLAEYLGEAGDRVPWFMNLAVGAAPRSGPSGPEGWPSRAGRGGAHGPEVHRRGHAGRGVEDRPRPPRKGLGFTADLLGEAVISEAEADGLSGDLPRTARRPGRSAGLEPEDPRTSTATPDGPIPRANLSLKLTSLTPRFDPIDAEGTTRRVLDRLRPILRTARRWGRSSTSTWSSTSSRT